MERPKRADPSLLQARVALKEIQQAPARPHPEHSPIGVRSGTQCYLCLPPLERAPLPWSCCLASEVEAREFPVPEVEAQGFSGPPVRLVGQRQHCEDQVVAAVLWHELLLLSLRHWA